MLTQKRILIPLSLIFLFPYFNCSPSSPSNSSPVCSITSHTDGTILKKGETARFTVDASDSDGEIVSVRILLDGMLILTDEESPYVLDWSVSEGDFEQHTIEAMATDDEGASSSDRINIILDWGPTEPEQVENEWETSTIGIEGLSDATITQMMRKIYRDMDEYLHCILILKNGKLVLEEYFRTADRDDLFHLQSTTKTFTSALIGIAIDNGYIESLDEPVYQFFPEYAGLFNDPKKQITIEHFITMSSGLEWNEVSTSILGAENDNIIGNYCGDYIGYVLSKPLIYQPGTHYYYNSGGVMALGGIIYNTAGIHADRFAEIFLFGPLGITDYFWPGQADGLPWTSGGLALKPRDMLKFGLLYLNGGVWDNEQVINSEFVEDSVTPFISMNDQIEYGYLWWLQNWDGYDVHYTSGYGGQNIFIIPELGIVVAATADYSNAARVGLQQMEVWALVEDYVVPAASR